MKLRIAAIAAALLPVAAAGCGESGGGNRSPMAADDPAALERARAEAEQSEQQARAAEAAAVGDAFRGVERP